MLKIPELRGLSASNSDKTSSIFKGKRWKMTLERRQGAVVAIFHYLNGWVDWDKKMETMMDSAIAKRLLDAIIESFPAHRRAVIHEEITYSDFE